ncbi:uncharacterized protein LOC106050575 isoform X2 [Biomphalaria glabrata]|uniref:Uncharacterized protein LOC106050575 isoform X2 n=1 Tax=Biomphalaria glabrata TaxID=6526 RepID=A0A9W2ZHZ6_BIOGL|nr:uncharacterized protein LOC106050575 isoform X2 [Biomphalaria glabrata]
MMKLATGKLPFATLNTNERNSVLQPIELMNVIIEEPQIKLPMGQFSQNLIDFVNRCLRKMPALRLSGQDLLQCPDQNRHQF